LVGSGKSTIAKGVVKKLPNFTRLSVDAYVHANHGFYGKDYPDSKYSEYLSEARAALRTQLIDTLRTKNGVDVVLDFAFAFKDDRDAWKKTVEEEGGRWVLVYLDASRDTAWRRIQERKAKGLDADSAYEITEEILNGYVKGFEVPKGEGEVVLRVV
jgi:predicted kinase